MKSSNCDLWEVQVGRGESWKNNVSYRAHSFDVCHHLSSVIHNRMVVYLLQKLLGILYLCPFLELFHQDEIFPSPHSHCSPKWGHEGIGTIYALESWSSDFDIFDRWVRDHFFTPLWMPKKFLGNFPLFQVRIWFKLDDSARMMILFLFYFLVLILLGGGFEGCRRSQSFKI